MAKRIKLRVQEASKGDVGRQIARIPADLAESIGVKTGDVLEIKGKRATYAQAWRSNQDSGTAVIKIEKAIRRNAGVGLDDIVEVTKVEKIISAKSITISLSENLPDDYFAQILRAMDNKIVGRGDIIPVSIGFGNYITIKVEEIIPSTPAIVTTTTKILKGEKQTGDYREDTKNIEVSYEDIGGLSEPIRKIREMVELPLKFPEIFDHLGISAPKGVLMFGPPGTGKTLLAKAVATETNSHFITINGPEIMSKYYGESEEKLRSIFMEAKNEAPTIIFIDEIDAIAPKRSESGGETERRIVAQLLTLMDGLDDRGQIVVIAATNRPNSVDEALRRGGRFDREIEIGVPDKKGRAEILEIHTRGMPLSSDVNIENIAERLHGYVGADIAILVKEAAMVSLRRNIPETNINEGFPLDGVTLNKIQVTMDDFLKAMEEVKPSALREVFVEKPEVNWNDIGGLETVKRELIKTIEWPIKYPDLYRALGMKTSRGILLHGPPGTGKTLMARAVAGEINANFISIKGPELLSKFVGETERAIREIFEKARRASPTIIFFDEIDAIASQRRRGVNEVSQRIVSQLLTEMDGLQELHGVYILAATNRPDIIDPALRRPGRLTKIIKVGHPDAKARKEILEVHLRNVIIDNSDIEKLVNLTEGYTGAELTEIVNLAKEDLIEELIESGKITTTQSKVKLKWKHFQKGLNEVIPAREEYKLQPPKVGEINYGEEFI